MNHHDTWYVPLLVSALFLAACRESQSPRELSKHRVATDTVRLTERSRKALRFQIAPAQASTPLAPVAVAGRVTTIDHRTSPVVAPLEGHIVKVSVSLGERVKSGAKLALVRTPHLAEWQRGARASEVALRTRQSTVARLRQLVEQRIAPQHDLIVAESELEEARVSRDAARARLQSLSILPEGDTAYWLLAARPGTVVQLSAAPGELVGPNAAKTMATVADIDEVLVIADLPAGAVRDVAPGTIVEIRSPGSTSDPVLGRVELVAAVMDPDRQTVPIRIRVDNSGHLLRPNAYVDAQFLPSDRTPTVQVPASAVVRDGLAAVVFVQVGPDSVRKRTVQLGRQAADRVEVLAGLSEGDPIVTSGALLLLNALDIEG